VAAAEPGVADRLAPLTTGMTTTQGIASSDWTTAHAPGIARAQIVGNSWLAGKLLYDAVWDAAERDTAIACRRKREIDGAVSAVVGQPKPRGVRHHVAELVTNIRLLSYIALGPRWHRLLYYRPVRRPTAPTSPVARQKPASIVMLTFNRQAYVRQSLTALYASLTAETDYEIIVVDNGSTDGTVALLRQHANERKIHKLILRRANHGTSAGFNCGFSYARKDSEYLVRLDSDISILTPGWLSTFRVFLDRNHHVGAVALFQPNHPVLRLLPAEDNPGDTRLVDWARWCIGGAAMTIPRRVFERVGFLREDFGFNYVPDDADYYYRLKMFGYKAYYLRDFLGYHHMEKDLGEYRAYSKQKSALTGANQLSAWSLIFARLRKRTIPWERAMQESRADYGRDCGAASIRYSHYDNVVFPDSTRVLEVS
jgi:glycosyltransferase involved in cell wall biosynthesis